MSDYTIIVEEADNIIIEVGIQGPVGATGPAGGGDMTKIVYDADNDGVVDEAEKIDGGTFI